MSKDPPTRSFTDSTITVVDDHRLHLSYAFRRSKQT